MIIFATKIIQIENRKMPKEFMQVKRIVTDYTKYKTKLSDWCKKLKITTFDIEIDGIKHKFWYEINTTAPIFSSKLFPIEEYKKYMKTTYTWFYYTKEWCTEISSGNDEIDALGHEIYTIEHMEFPEEFIDAKTYYDRYTTCRTNLSTICKQEDITQFTIVFQDKIYRLYYVVKEGRGLNTEIIPEDLKNKHSKPRETWKVQHEIMEERPTKRSKKE